MRFNPRIWTPIAQILVAVNVAAIYFAAQAAEPVHATLHGSLAVVCLLWAERLRARAHQALDEGDETQPDLMPGEVDHLRNELAEVQERLDFAERMLTQRHEQDRVPHRGQ